jgi:SAM-dependent methyltransferase
MIAPAPATLYDDVYYPGRAYEHTHPNRLATLATLYGMTPSPPERCRVLELGCGVGGNLLPLAFQYPESEFVGIDLSKLTIERGQRNLAGLGLANVKLLHCDIMDVDASFGQFDYIVAHGVYSWVPPAVRSKMMAIFKERLSPQGVAYVSYNAHPFSHVRDLARDMMLFHTRHLTDMNQKVAQARAVMKFLSEGSKVDTVHGAIMRDQYTRVTKMLDEVLFHDDLNETAEAFLLHQVVEFAGEHGLQYLSDAEFSRRNLAGYSDEVRAALQRFPDDEFMARDQYQDFIDGFGFRRTLLCHGGIPLRRKLDMDFVRRFHLLSSTEPVTTEFCLTDASELEFKTQEGSSLSVSHPLLKSAYLSLGRAWPATLTFDELIQEASRQLDATNPQVPSAEDVQLLVEAMFVLACSGEVGFFQSRPNLTRRVGDRPFASPVARRQSESDTMVTNMLHQTVRLEDQKGCEILRLLDGSRSFDELLSEIVQRNARDESGESLHPQADIAAVTESLRRFLQTAAKLGLLVDQEKMEACK